MRLVLHLTFSMFAACLLVGFSTTVGGASAAASVQTPATDLLLSPAYAKGLGFSKTTVAPTHSSNTGTKKCPKSVYTAYEDADGQKGLSAGVFACRSKAAAISVLAQIKKRSTVQAMTNLPVKLGRGTFYSSSPPFFAITWQRGSRVAYVQFDADITDAKNTQATIAPIDQQKLVNAAVEQHASLD